MILFDREGRAFRGTSLIGSTALGLALVVSGCSSPAADSGQSSPPPGTSQPGSADSGAPSSTTQEKPHIDGQITALNGATWTVKTIDGKTYTVITTDSTKFGDQDRPQTSNQFKVGDNIDITGTANGTTITATAIETY